MPSTAGAAVRSPSIPHRAADRDRAAAGAARDGIGWIGHGVEFLSIRHVSDVRSARHRRAPESASTCYANMA